ncbi:MAG: hypothetical protein KDK70_20410 [Myxococcales bacterium]|nr:hypothetical protein [Myxococcales bacterium]
MAREVTLVDAGLGNLASVERALIQVRAGVRVTSDPDKVATSRMVVFPGQSAFGAATQAIVDGAMGAALRMVIERGDPFLGICLGMQLLFDGSDENGGQEGLHVLPGRCRRFPDNQLEEAEPGAIERPMSPAMMLPHDAAPAQSDYEAPGPEEPSSAAPAEAPAEHAAEAPAEAAAVEPGAVPPPPDWSGPTIEQVGHGTTITTDMLPSEIVAAGAAADEPDPEPDPEAPPLMRRVKVPHMGWNEVEPTGTHYYFVHSYYVEPERPEDVMWMSRYGGIRFPAAVRRGNVMGCQFHPEKSQRAGLRFLRAFLLGGWG